MVNPFRIFLFFIIVIASLVGFIFLFPSGKVEIAEGYAINFFPKEKLFSSEKKEVVDIAEIIETGGAEVADTQQVAVNVAAVDSFKIDPADVVIVKHKIQYPEGRRKVLLNFFESLDGVRTANKHIRILHYGDSQLEGDRITSALRKRFQENKNFGGFGVGLIPVKDILQGRFTLQQESSGNWKKYALYQKNSQKIPHKKYSLLGSIFRFTPYPPADDDTTGREHGPASPAIKNDSSVASFLNTSYTQIPSDQFIKEKEHENVKPYSFDEEHTAWFTVGKSNMAYKTAQNIENVKLLYTYNPQPVNLTLTINDTVIEDVLEPSEGLTMMEWPVEQPFRKITFEFTGKISPDIYGIALDGNTGVSVDNIAMRGTAITSFTEIDVDHLSRMIRQMNVELVILQFGVNVVPNVIEDYTYYERLIYKQLKRLKEAAPEVSVLVVGVSDMSRKEGLEHVSYPNIVKIRNAQKNAAFKAGCAFWDLYEAMGGENSMISWVHNEPAYAEIDYTHFNHRGAQVIGKMIYDALMEEYYVYKKVITQ